MKSLLLLLSSITAVHLASADVQLHGTPVELKNALADLPRMANIRGSAEFRTNANRARVDVLVVTEARSLESALTDNARQREQLVNALARRGVDANQIRNSEFSSSKQHTFFGDKVKSYRIENHVIVTLQNGEQLRALAKQIDALSDVTLQSVEFERSDEREMHRQVVEQALADANAQKAVYEKALNVQLTARTFSEGHGPSAPRQYITGTYGGGGGGIGAQAGSPPASVGGFSSYAEPNEPVFAFGELIFSADVVVEFAVEPQK